MSLFENSSYHWRETYFLFLKSENRPQEADVIQALLPLKGRLHITDSQDDKDGCLESMTVLAPADSAGIDVSYVTGEEIIEQRGELKKELTAVRLSDEDRAKLKLLLASDARFDLFHFQQMGDDPEDDDILDPGALLSVLSRLAKLCQGIAYDPQAGTFVP